MFIQENRVNGILNVYTRKQSLWYTECLYKKTEFMVYWMFIRKQWYKCLYKITGFMVYWMFIQENRVMVYWMFIQENRVYGILNVYTRKQS